MDSVLLSYKPRQAELEAAGFGDPVPGTRGQVPNATENVLVIPWNDLPALEAMFAQHGGEIAAVITEPVLCNSGCLLAGENYLAKLAEIARRHGALVIFDEVITGFRRAPGGAQAFYGVTPDMATLGKAIGGGLALSAIAGRRELLDLMFTGGVSFGGTFNGNPLSLAAGVTTIRELTDNRGAALEGANRTGESLMKGLRELGARHGLPLRVTGFGTAFAVHFNPLPEITSYRDTFRDDSAMLSRFLLESCREGVNIVPDGRFYVSTVHTADDVQQTLAAIDKVFARLA
jgi:glutamate-1-semialdehyde 2,1-aminomutase